jgi:hypothetical protein
MLKLEDVQIFAQPQLDAALEAIRTVDISRHTIIRPETPYFTRRSGQLRRLAVFRPRVPTRSPDYVDGDLRREMEAIFGPQPRSGRPRRRAGGRAGSRMGE